MKARTSIIISLIISLAVIFFSFNVPAHWFSVRGTSETLGTVSVTTLNSTDNISDFPTTYNANLNALNNGKVDIASTTWAQLTTAANLATVGTITSGTWTGSAVGAAYGGTGSTTLSQYQVLLGNGTGIVEVPSNGWGTSGQFLTSQGAGSLPQWTTSALSLTDNYAWGGYHTFASSTNFTATSTNLHYKLTVASTTPDTAVSHATGFKVATTTYFANAVSIGFATTSANTDFEVAGNAIIGGAASTSQLTISNNCIGCPTDYTASSTSWTDQPSGGTFTGAIPANANMGIGQFLIEETTGGDVIMEGTFMIMREGLTSATIHIKIDSSDDDGDYTITWSGANLVIGENSDTASDSQLTGTIYWYK